MLKLINMVGSKQWSTVQDKGFISDHCNNLTSAND